MDSETTIDRIVDDFFFKTGDVMSCIDQIVNDFSSKTSDVLSCVFRNSTILDVRKHLRRILALVFEKLGKSDLIDTTCSSGLVLVLLFKDYVVKILSPQSFDNTMIVYELIAREKNVLQNFTKFLFSNKDLSVIVEERVAPITFNGELADEFKNPDVLKKMSTDITDALFFLGSHNTEHGDCTLDNIGYRKASDSFVLFDYNAAKKITDINLLSDDFHKFKKSVAFHGLTIQGL